MDVWRDNRGFCQELAGLRPSGPPEQFEPPAGSGIRITFTLDEQTLPTNAALPADLDGLDVHGPYCAEAEGPGHVVIHDHRHDDQACIHLS